MNVPLNEFNEEQRLWYGYLIASATKADGAVNPSEIEFLISALHFLDARQKSQVRAYLRSNSLLPGLEKIPTGINRKHLANIFTDLIWVIVADGKLTKTEQNFLKTVATWFGFAPEILNRLLQWGEQMLKAEKFRRQILENI